MNASRSFRGGIVGHEEGHLMPVVEIVDVHAHAPFCKREHDSLSAAWAYIRKFHAIQVVYHIKPLSPN